MEHFDQTHLGEFGFTKEALEPYFAGITASDGHIESDTNRTIVATKNLEFANRIIEPVLKGQGYEYSFFWDEGAGVYKIAINNEQLRDRLTDTYNIPSGKKAAKIEPPEDLDSEETLWYVRGWFDGEGWPEQLTVYEGDTEYNYPRVGLKIMSEGMRDWIAQYLQDQDIRVTTYDRQDGSHGLWINGYEECRKFDKIIGFRHPEQNKKLHELLAHE